MDNLVKRVDHVEKKIDKHEEELMFLNKENARNVTSIKSLWENDKKLDKCIEKLTDAINESNKINIKLSGAIEKLEYRMVNEEKETEKRNKFKDTAFSKVVFGILAVLGAGLCTLTLMGIVEWIRQIK